MAKIQTISEWAMLDNCVTVAHSFQLVLCAYKTTTTKMKNSPTFSSLNNSLDFKVIMSSYLTVTAG